MDSPDAPQQTGSVAKPAYGTSPAQCVGGSPGVVYGTMPRNVVVDAMAVHVSAARSISVDAPALGIAMPQASCLPPFEEEGEEAALPVRRTCARCQVCDAPLPNDGGDAVRYYAIWYLPADPDMRGQFAMSRIQLGNLVNAGRERDRGSARIARCCSLAHAFLKYESETPGPRRRPR